MEHKPIVERVHGEKLETSALGLMFYVKPKYVKSGLKLECTASIGSVYWQSFLETPKVSPKEQIAISGNWWTTSDANGKRNLKPYFAHFSCKISNTQVLLFGQSFLIWRTTKSFHVGLHRLSPVEKPRPRPFYPENLDTPPSSRINSNFCSNMQLRTFSRNLSYYSRSFGLVKGASKLLKSINWIFLQKNDFLTCIFT